MGSNWPSKLVNRRTANSMRPPKANRRQPVKTGGQLVSNHLVPALLPPQRVTTNNKLKATAPLSFFSDTRRD
jgi:hypothetical protein